MNAPVITIACYVFSLVTIITMAIFLQIFGPFGASTATMAIMMAMANGVYMVAREDERERARNDTNHS